MGLKQNQTLWTILLTTVALSLGQDILNIVGPGQGISESTKSASTCKK